MNNSPIFGTLTVYLWCRHNGKQKRFPIFKQHGLTHEEAIAVLNKFRNENKVEDADPFDGKWTASVIL